VKLLPCPFCGGSALGVDHPPHKHYFVPMPDHPGSYTIECAACNIGLIDDTKEKAEAAWNKRVPYVSTLPSRFQLGDKVRARGTTGLISGICFRAGKIHYEVGGVMHGSEDVMEPLAVIGNDNASG
jgi:hypothetical protein